MVHHKALKGLGVDMPAILDVPAGEAVLALEDIGGAPIVPAALSMSTIRPKKVTVGTAVASFDGCSHPSRVGALALDPCVIEGSSGVHRILFSG